MASYKLTYFNGRGRAECTRLLFALGDVKYEDERFDSDKWDNSKLKADAPFGQLPILEADGTVICQSHTIERFIANRIGMYGKDDLEQARSGMIVECIDDMFQPLVQTFSQPEEKRPELRRKYAEETMPPFLAKLEKMISSDGFFISDKIMLPDVVLYALLENYPGYWLDEKLLSQALDKCPKIKALTAKVAANPNIAKWLAERPSTVW